MKAIVFHEHGGPDVLRYEDVPDPEPGPGEVVLRVGAVSINPGPDTLTRQHGFGMPEFRLPHVTGSDPAGEIVAVGGEVGGFAVGDRVVVDPIMPCGECSFCRAGAPENYCRRYRLFGVQTWGGRADYVRVQAEQLVRLPDNVVYEAAATLPISYATTFHGMVARAALQPGESLLVMGAGGGCGAAAVQLGKHLGARVFALTGAQWKEDRLRELGADVVLSYRSENWPEQVRKLSDGNGVNVVFDSVGGSTWPKTIGCLDRGGRLFCCGGASGLELQLEVRRLYREQITLHFFVGASRADLEHMVDLVARGELEPVIDSVLPLRDAAQGDERLAAHQQFGKIVLVP